MRICYFKPYNDCPSCNDGNCNAPLDCYEACEGAYCKGRCYENCPDRQCGNHPINNKNLKEYQEEQQNDNK